MAEETSNIIMKDLLPTDLTNELGGSIFKDKITIPHPARFFDESKKTYSKVSIPPLKPHIDKDLYLPEEGL